MIEINLLPQTGKKARSSRSSGGGGGFGGGGLQLGASLSGIFSKITDPYLLGCVFATALSIVAVGGLWVTQSARARDLTEREQRAVQDSTRFAAVLAERRGAEAERDAVLRQIEIIKSIDNNRFVWAHVMDEVSRALPAYTWLTSMAQTSAPPTAQSAAAAVSAKKGKASAATGKGGAATAPTAGQSAAGAATPNATAGGAARPDSAQLQPPGYMKFQIVGQTIDIQALTRFMKDLEASPFVHNVQLAKTSIVVQEGKEVTEFRLDAEYQTPEPGTIRMVPVSLSVR